MGDSASDRPTCRRSGQRIGVTVYAKRILTHVKVRYLPNGTNNRLEKTGLFLYLSSRFHVGQ